MDGSTEYERRQVDLPEGALARAGQTLGRGLLRRCPYCGGGGVFRNWLALKERCPHCNTLFAPEDGYFLGAYPINLVLTSLIAVGIIVWLIAATELTVLQMQIIAVLIVVGLPLLLYPYALSLWMSLDLVLHPPSKSSGRPRV